MRRRTHSSTTLRPRIVAVFAGFSMSTAPCDVGNGFRQDWPDCAHDTLASADRIAGDKVHEVGARNRTTSATSRPLSFADFLNRPEPGAMFPSTEVRADVYQDNARDATHAPGGWRYRPERLDKPRMTISLIVPVIA